MTETPLLSRVSRSVIDSQHVVVAGVLQGRLAETLPIPFIVLNENRQIVFANSLAVALFGKQSLDEMLGARPGEQVYCVHAMEAGSCGVAPACGHCGNVRAVLGAHESGEVRTEESRILTIQHGTLNALNLRVDAASLDVDGEPFTIVYLQDISREKDRELLEQFFMHDALNALGGISGAARLLSGATEGDMHELATALEQRSSLLVRDVQFMQLLFAAEEGMLQAQLEAFSALALLEEIRMLCAASSVAEGKSLLLAEGLADVTITTDKGLLNRALENLVKNALEASRPGEPVTLGFIVHPKSIHFYVKSLPFMPKHVQQQVFQRTFSTKGRGRGIGAYSARLFLKNYLGGSVSFESTPDAGTTFFVQIPLNPS